MIWPDHVEFLHPHFCGSQGEEHLHLVQVWKEKPQLQADVVLVDAPCSSSGVLRRHPSQRWAISFEDVLQLAPCPKIATKGCINLL